MKKVILASFSILAFSASAMAGGYKQAGCGLGSLAITEGGFMQVFAATTNGTSGSQTFGITSGTSNCGGSGGYANADVEKEMYITSNFDNLTQEIAQGSGEHLSALSSLMGCDQAAADDFAAVLKSNSRRLSGEKSAEQLLDAIQTTVSSNPQLKKACKS